MDFNDPLQRSVFFDVHSGLPREGPGNATAADQALEIVGPLPAPAQILDIGCGPGKQTLHLAERFPEARIVAIDLHPPFLDALRSSATASGFADRIEAQVGDMTALDFPPGSLDLIWCEGAAYNMGFRKALASWKPFLKPEGRLALTEPVWLKPDPPAPVEEFWQAYPAMRDLATRRKHLKEAGYKLLGDFVLPEEAWWDDYYSPMTARISELRSKYKGNTVAESVLAECEEEIEFRQRYSDFYNYGFFVLAKYL